MIGLDTNVLVRYLTQDEPRQAALATRLIEKRLTPQAPGFVGLVVTAAPRRGGCPPARA